MDFQSELHSISVELNSIIRELEDIHGQMNTGNFEGIDIEKCASVVDERLSSYRKAKRKLDSVDTTKVDDEEE